MPTKTSHQPFEHHSNSEITRDYLHDELFSIIERMKQHTVARLLQQSDDSAVVH